MVRPFAMDDPVAGIALESLLHVFLQQGLVVLLVAILENLVDLGNEQVADEKSGPP